MACLNDGVLRAAVDGELGEAQKAQVDEHCAQCDSCRVRYGEISHNAQTVGNALSTLQAAGEQSTDTAGALARVKARAKAERRPATALSAIFDRPLRLYWALGAACLALAFFAFVPTRSFAQRLIAMLRVQRVTAVPLDFEFLGDPGERRRLGQSVAQLFSENVVVTAKGELREVASREEASQEAGFQIRLPANRSDAGQLRVLGEQAFHATIDRDRLQAIMEEIGRADLELPDALDGATVAARFMPIVFAKYGCRSETADRSQDCVHLVQSRSPTVTVPPELNLPQLAQIALQLGGMSAQAAGDFSRTVDWETTLVIGIPQGSSYRTVEVDGVQGTLIQRGRSRPAYSLIWVKDGIIYALYGTGNSSDALTLARSLN